MRLQPWVHGNVDILWWEGRLPTSKGEKESSSKIGMKYQRQIARHPEVVLL